MIIRVGYDIVFELPAPTPMVVLLNLHPSRIGDVAAPDRILTEPEVPVRSISTRLETDAADSSRLPALFVSTVWRTSPIRACRTRSTAAPISIRSRICLPRPCSF